MGEITQAEQYLVDRNFLQSNGLPYKKYITKKKKQEAEPEIQQPATQSPGRVAPSPETPTLQYPSETYR